MSSVEPLPRSRWNASRGNSAREVLEQHLVLRRFRRLAVDRVDLEQREVALAVLGRADLADEVVAGAQVEAADLRRRHVDVVGAGEVALLGRAQEAEAVLQDLEHAFAVDAFLRAAQHLQQVEDDVLLARARHAFLDADLLGQVERAACALMRLSAVRRGRGVRRQRRQRRGAVAALGASGRRGLSSARLPRSGRSTRSALGPPPPPPPRLRSRRRLRRSRRPRPSPPSRAAVAAFATAPSLAEWPVVAAACVGGAFVVGLGLIAVGAPRFGASLGIGPGGPGLRARRTRASCAWKILEDRGERAVRRSGRVSAPGGFRDGAELSTAQRGGNPAGTARSRVNIVLARREVADAASARLASYACPGRSESDGLVDQLGQLGTCSRRRSASPGPCRP